MRHIRSMYWSNIHPSIVAQQRRVLRALGYEITQDEATGVHHGLWLNRSVEAIGEDDAILFLDIDCFPLRRDIVERAFAAAEHGVIFGVAQTANHLPNRDFMFAGPTYLCLTKHTWTKLGRPPLTTDETHDVAMRLSEVAVAQGTPLDLLMPSFVCVPKWPLADKGCLGVATFYDGGAVFHLFESRAERGYRWAIDYVADCVVEQRPIDYKLLHTHLNSLRMRCRRWSAKRVERMKRWWAKSRRPVASSNMVLL